LAPRPLPADKGLALVVGAGAAMAAQGSSSSVAVDFKFKGFDVFGAGAAMAPHKSSSSSLLNFDVLLGRKIGATNKNSKPFKLMHEYIQIINQVHELSNGFGILILHLMELSNFQANPSIKQKLKIHLFI
jgi:hypothetical protein